MARTVGEVAALAHVTVRALHHYDAIGLVRPSGRTDAGYRLYDEQDLERLQQVLLYRELGFALDDIGALMGAADFDRGRALREQRDLLEADADRLGAMIAAVDAAIQALENGTIMSEEQMFEVFGERQREWQQEAEERWAGTEAWRASARRAKRYTTRDWEAIREESESIMVAIADAYRSGADAVSEAAMDAVESHRRQISRRFYECSHEMQVGLGEMYVADPRFRATYEEIESGLAEWVRDAIVANAARAGA